MHPEQYLITRSRQPALESGGRLGDAGANALDDLVHSRGRILGRKLDVLSAEIWWRLYLASGNLARLNDDREQLSHMFDRLDRQANYGLREHSEKGILYRKLMDLRTEERSQRVECWKDVVQVMRDFLETWDAHEQAQGRARFIHDVGTRTQGYV